MIAKCLSRYIVGCVLGSLIGLAVLSHDSFIETERALASYLSNIPVVGHGVFDVPPRSPIPPGHNEPPIDHIIGTSMYFRIPTIRVAADQVNVDSRWDIEANTEHGVIVRAHGWSARARDQSSPELRARGLLYCWVQDNDYPNGYIVKHPDLGKFYPSMTDRNGQLIHAEYYTELRRASCAGCYPGIQAADQSKCRLRAMSHYDDQGVRVSVGEHHEWFTTSKPPNMEEHPRITQLRSGVLSTQDHDGNVVEAWTRNYYVYGGCFGGSCLPAGSPGAPWSKSAEDERGGAQVYNSTDYGGSNAWDGCHGDAPGTPCAAGLPDPTTYPGCPNGDSSTWTSTVTVMHQGRQYWCAWSPVASFRVAQYLDFETEVEGRLSYWNAHTIYGSRCGASGLVSNCGVDIRDNCGAPTTWFETPHPEVGIPGWNRYSGVFEIDGDRDCSGQSVTARAWGDGSWLTPSSETVGYVIERYTAWTWVEDENKRHPGTSPYAVVYPEGGGQQAVWFTFSEPGVSDCVGDCPEPPH